MKAKLHLTPELQKAVDEYAEEKIKDIESRTLKRIQDAMTGPVADKYNEYRNDQLADTWAQVTLQNIGVDVAETGEQL